MLASHFATYHTQQLSIIGNCLDSLQQNRHHWESFVFPLSCSPQLINVCLMFAANRLSLSAIVRSGQRFFSAKRGPFDFHVICASHPMLLQTLFQGMQIVRTPPSSREHRSLFHMFGFPAIHCVTSAFVSEDSHLYTRKNSCFAKGFIHCRLQPPLEIYLPSPISVGFRP